jgi:tRNA nucleotidyltransferase (CCA-adding enzyme)
MQIIIPHKNVDFDALASVVAASLLYPEAVPVLPNSVNPNVRGFLSIHKNILSFWAMKDIDPEKVNRLIVVDANRWMRLENTKTFMKRADMDVHVWDHHPEIGDITPTGGRQEMVGASVTLLVEAIKEKNIPFSSILSTLFLAGIYEDTGHLTFPSTTPKDLRAAAFLLENLADLNVIQTILRPTYGPKQKDILFKMLADAKRSRLNGYRISVSKIELEGHIPGLAEVVSMYRNVVNVDVAFGIFKDKQGDRCMVIGRSGVDSFDVGAVMRIMGGGGHAAAGSAMLKSVSPDGVEVWLSELIRDYRQMPIQISDLMSFPVESVTSDMTAHRVAEILKQKGYSGMPVVENEKLVGIISKRDLDKLNKDIQWRSPVKAFMSRDVLTITPRHSVSEAMRILIKHDIGRLPVLEDNRLIGILTRSDAMIYYYDMVPD